MNTVEQQHSSCPDDLRGFPKGGKVERMLIVDDDHSIRETLRLLLEDAGYHVTEACNGLEALTLLRDERASYITLLDLCMPQLNGAALLGIVAEDPDLARRHSFILMTADTRAMSRLFADHLARLAVPMLAKPFDIDDLFDLVERATQRLKAKKHYAGNLASHNAGQRQSA